MPEPPDAEMRGGTFVVGVVVPPADGAMEVACGVLVDGVTIEPPGRFGDVVLVDAVDEDGLPTASHAPPPMSSTSTAAIAASAGVLGRRFHQVARAAPGGSSIIPEGGPWTRPGG